MIKGHERVGNYQLFGLAGCQHIVRGSSWHVCTSMCICTGADPGFLKGGGAPPTFYILKACAHAHHMNRTEHEHLS